MPEITLQQGAIRYQDTGAGPPVVFVHGAARRRRAVGAGHVAAGRRAAAASRPTCRWARTAIALRPQADRTPQGVARLVGDLLEALDLADVTLVANDTGGAIAQLVALDHGERLGRLVFTNCDCFEVFPPQGVRGR